MVNCADEMKKVRARLRESAERNAWGADGDKELKETASTDGKRRVYQERMSQEYAQRSCV